MVTAATVGGIVITASIMICAIGLQRTRHWQPFSFSCWVLAFVTAALFFPVLFSKWGTHSATSYISLLIQIIMFGMGTTLSWQDFARVLLRPKAVLIGMLLQFSIMPVVGWGLAKAVNFPPEIAAGVILIGSCPGGVASNVIAYLARGDVALSVTMTACSTLAAPILTPLMMSLLAGAEIDIRFFDMMWGIIQIVIFPILGGLLANYGLQRAGWRGPWLDSLLSAIAMFAICVVIGIIVAQSRNDLLTVGPLILLVAVLHNSIGYGLGYVGAKSAGLSEAECRTVSIEAGMQNGGMGTAIATKFLNSTQAALAPAIFGPWMSIAGSVLASYWRRRPVVPEAKAEPIVVVS